MPRSGRSSSGCCVALLAEGVDRNGVEDQLLWTVAGLSPSSRRAWIEILQDMDSGLLVWVALLAEGVDRNQRRQGGGLCVRRRPPRGGRG